MNREGPDARVLHEAIARAVEARGIARRGRAYAHEGRVEGLERMGHRLEALVRGTAPYRVSIWVSHDRIGYACSCPAAADGDFCKHCVAVAITWLERDQSVIR